MYSALLLPLILTLLALILVVLLSVHSHTGHSARTARGQATRFEEEEPLLTPEEQQAPLGDDRLTSEENQWKLAYASKAEELEIARENIAILERDLSRSASQIAELERQNDILSRDMEGARLFLTTADAFSDSEIIQTLRKLNAELQHISTTLADRAVSVLKLGPVTVIEPNHQDMMNRATESIGSTLARSFEAARPDELAMYLQIAFQAYLTHRLHRIVSSWTFDQDRNTFLDETYQRLREAESQPISARWRSLTRAYVRPTCTSEPNSFIAPVIAGLSDVLFAAGCSTSLDHTPELHSALETSALSVVLLAARLNQMIGAVISSDLEVFVVRPGQPFLEEMMEEDTDGGEDGVEETRTGAAEKVLCTSELGLRKRVQLGEAKRTETRMVVKAKVILETFLNVVD